MEVHSIKEKALKDMNQGISKIKLAGTSWVSHDLEQGFSVLHELYNNLGNF